MHQLSTWPHVRDLVYVHSQVTVIHSVSTLGVNQTSDGIVPNQPTGGLEGKLGK